MALTKTEKTICSSPTRNEVRLSYHLHGADDTTASANATWISRSQPVQYDEDEHKHKHNDGDEDKGNYNSDGSNHDHDHSC